MTILPSQNTISSDILMKLNDALKSDSILSDIEIGRMKQQARSLNAPESFACLSAVFSYLHDEKQTIENAERVFNYNNMQTRVHSLIALHKLNLHKTIPDYHRASAKVNNFSGIGGDFAPHLISVLNISSTRKR